MSSRYEYASLILTSNLPFSGWGSVFGDQTVAAAMNDRIIHHADVLTLEGASYGFADAASTPCPASEPNRTRTEVLPVTVHFSSAESVQNPSVVNCWDTAWMTDQQFPDLMRRVSELLAASRLQEATEVCIGADCVAAMVNWLAATDWTSAASRMAVFHEARCSLDGRWRDDETPTIGNGRELGAESRALSAWQSVEPHLFVTSLTALDRTVLALETSSGGQSAADALLQLIRIRLAAMAVEAHVFYRRGLLQDLGIPVSLAREAFARVRRGAEEPPGADAPEVAHVFAQLLFERFGKEQRPIRELDEAVEAATCAYEWTSTADVNRCAYAVNLAEFLGARFGARWGATGDVDADHRLSELERAVACTAAAWEQVGSLVAGEQAASVAVAYSHALVYRFEAGGGSPADLDTAVQLARAAYESAPPESPLGRSRGSNYAAALRRRSEYDRGIAHQHMSQAYQAAPAESEERTANVARWLWREGDQERAVMVWRELLESASTHGMSRDLQEALEEWARSVSGTPWGLSGVEALVGLVRGAEQAVAAGDREVGEFGVWCAATLLAAQKVLADGGSSGTNGQFDAGWFARACDRLDPAGAGLPLYTRAARAGLAASEATRGLWLSRAVQSSRTELGLLRALQPRLADEYSTITGQLMELDLVPSRFETTSDEEPVRSVTQAAGVTGRVELEQRRRSLLARIRSVAGFERFALPPLIDQLLDGVPAGGVVVIPVAAPGTDYAWMLVLVRGQVSAVPLPGVTWQRLQQITQLWQACSHIHHASRRIGLQRRVVAWLWQHLAAPVDRHLLEYLRHHSQEHVDRVWWVVTAAFGTLPIGVSVVAQTGDSRVTDLVDPGVGPGRKHGVSEGETEVLSRLRSATQDQHRPGSDTEDIDEVAQQLLGSPSGVQDASEHESILADLVASRIPTVGLLDGDPGPRVPGVLAVGVGRYPPEHSRALQSLDFTEREAQDVAMAYQPPGDLRQGETAIRARILAELPKFGTVHFACHGILDDQHDMRSRLELYDEAVTLADLCELELDGWLAVLSACDSNRPTDEEHVTLATAVLLAGYRHAIAATNPVPDDATRTFMRHLHALVAQGESPAAALHLTRRWAQRVMDDPAVWANWVHAGP